MIGLPGAACKVQSAGPLQFTCNTVDNAHGADGYAGIGVIFDTRKGNFRYKISLYIVIYHDALIVYHCVSSCINVDIMSLDDT